MKLHAVPEFTIIDECDDWIVVDKAAPLIVHPANGKIEPNLLGGVEILLAYEMENGAALSIITRLDRETSGIVLIAKHRDAARELSRIFEHREAHKEYLAIVHEWPSFDTWTSDGPILRTGEIEPSRIWLRQMVHPAGRECETGFFVEKRFLRDGRKFALVRCYPKTGRMHQIRVHLAHAGHPIVGDKLYTGDGSEYLEWIETDWTDSLHQRLILRRHALHAARLSLQWRGSEKTWESTLQSELLKFSSPSVE